MIRPVNSSEQVWFQDTIRTQNFSVGVYQISRIRDKPVIVFGYPVIDETGKIKALVWAGMGLAWLNQSIAKINLPEGATLVVFDRDGTILARRPDPEKWVGQSIQKVSYFKTILDKGRGTVEAPGVDGIKRLYAFTTLEGLPEGSLYVKVGIPTQMAYAYIGKALMRNLTLLGLVGALSLAVSWFISTFTILKPVSALIEASKKMATGDLSGRAGLSHHEGEIGQLAQAFDEMGESLQKQENERKRTQEELKESEERYRSLFDNSIDAVLLTAPDGSIFRANPEACRIFGFTEEELQQFGRERVIDKTDARLPIAMEERRWTGRFKGELNFIRSDGTKFLGELSSNVFKDSHGDLRTSMIIRDIASRKQAEEKIYRLHRLYSVLSKMNEAIVRIHEPERLYEEVCKIAVEEGLFRMVWIGIVDLETLFVKPVVHWGFEEGYLDKLHISINPDIPEGRGPTGTAIREGRYFVCNDIESDPRMLPWREEALKRGYRSSAAFPLKVENKVIGAINFYKSGPSFFKEEEEVRLLTSLADDLSFAIESMESEKKRKRTEEAVRKSEERLRLVMDGLGPQMFVGLMDTEGVVLVANRPALEAAALRPEDIIGKPCPETYWWVYSDRVSQRLRAAIQRVAEGEAVRYDEQIRVAEGQLIWIDFSMQPLRDESGKIVFIVPSGNIITERKQAEEQLRISTEQLRSLSARLQAIREEERTTIAREIHDELGQSLTVLKMDSSWLAKRLPGDQKELIEKTKFMSKLIDDTIQMVRRISSELRPGILDDLGLIAAIEWQAKDFESRTGIKCEFESSLEEVELDKDRSNAVFRILQETLTNVVRHAKATQVKIDLQERESTLTLRIKDNGLGFRERDILNPKSLGLLGMRERAHIFGGEMEITSEHGKGTTVTVKIPLKTTGERR